MTKQHLSGYVLGLALSITAITVPWAGDCTADQTGASPASYPVNMRSDDGYDWLGLDSGEWLKG